MKTNFFRNIKLPLLGRGLGGGFLLLWGLGGGCALFAQNGNGVILSGLAVNAGTVTFNVNWQTPMPVALWSDTVWVFVDYNKNGVMERLPLLSGATLTATSAQDVGKVIEVSGNNQGVWVVGNARDAGAFSATVKLHTATANVAGACVYASNYPPVGNYTSATEISFTGTPLYTIVLKDTGGGTITRESGKLFSMPDGYMVQSFTDRTGAPGIIKCVPMTGNIDFTVPASVSKGLAASFVSTTSGFTTPPAAALTYTWSAPGFSPDTHTGATYTPTAPVNVGTYPVTLTASSEGYCNLKASNAVTVIDCIPGASGQAATTCGCAEGLCDYSGTCTTYCDNNKSCGFTELYPSDATHAGRETVEKAISICTSHGYSLPTAEQLLCLCRAGLEVPGGMINANYWTSSTYVYEGEVLLTAIEFPTCKIYGHDRTSNYNAVKCVK